MIQRNPRWTFKNTDYELHRAYYYEGYKNDSQFPELPCPAQHEDCVCPEEALYRKELAAFVRKQIHALSHRKLKKVLFIRFGIESCDDHTLEQVGKTMDVTQERIRQIESQALRILRHPSRQLHEVFSPHSHYKTTIEKAKKISEEHKKMKVSA